MSVKFAQKLARMPHYTAGLDIDAAREKYELQDVVKLASNESPFPPAQAVRDVIADGLKDLNRYPEAGAGSLRRALADHYDLPVGQVTVGNGSCEILLAAAEALIELGTEIVYAWPSFSIYPQMAALADALPTTVPLTDEHVHDLDAIVSATNKRTRLLVICNPNNPTGTYLPSEEISNLLEQVPEDVCVILDEAYIDFQTVEDPDTSLDLLSKYPNLAILRTFSKIYGLAGLRVGYALCSVEFRRAVDAVRQPFSVNRLAQAAAVEALKHQDDVTRRVEQNAVERLWVEEQLGKLGLESPPSQANFSWIDLGTNDEGSVVEGLARKGVIVRPGKAIGADGGIRVTYGTRSENERFIEALQSVINE